MGVEAGDRFVVQLQQRAGDLIGGAVAECDVGKQVLESAQLVVLEVTGQLVRRQHFERGAERIHGAIEHAMAEFDRVLVLQALEEVADRRARLRADHPFQPLRARHRGRRGDDFDRLAAAQSRAQRGQLLVDARGHGVAADVGMHGIGEIERRCIARQGQDLSARGEQVDLVGKQVDLYAFDELERGRRAVLLVDQARHPFAGPALRAVGRRRIALVGPVRGDAAISHRIHVLGADLDLDRLAERTEQHGVQRLVTVRLGYRDEVAKTAVQWLVERMHRAEGLIALHHRVDDDAKAIDIHDLGEGFLFGAHLAIDAVGRLDPADRAVRNALRLEPRIEGRLDLGHGLAAVAEGGADARRYDPVAIRIHGPEAKVLQFGLEPVHAQALGDRRVDFEGFEGDPAARRGLH